MQQKARVRVRPPPKKTEKRKASAMPEDRKTVQHKPERQKNSATKRPKTEKQCNKKTEDRKTVQQRQKKTTFQWQAIRRNNP